jgi:hypothetical protein
MRACDATDQARCRKDAVIGSQNSRPEPTKTTNGMSFRMMRDEPCSTSFYACADARPVLAGAHEQLCEPEAMVQNRLHRIRHESEDDRGSEQPDEDPNGYGGHQDSIRTQYADDREIDYGRHDKPPPWN